ncbi:hypothetical protein KKF84_17250 [Myxococcota bacterium]|nr:hypothetical protein [Myxococcota bacterium]MBU1537075.1 hypothetical protein [Myxococcota bacterium]
MWSYLKRHEAFILKLLKQAHEGGLSKKELEKIRHYHLRKIEFFQHERFIHLIVTLFMGLFLLLSLFFSMFHKTYTGLALSMLLLMLTTAYVVHYFHLENGVQRFYGYWEKLEIYSHNRPCPAKSAPSKK